MSPVYLRRSKPDKEPSSVAEPEGDLTKLLTMKKIAKGLVTMQKTRQQRLEDTGNVTLTRKLRKFEPDVVEKCLSDILQKHLRRLKYEPKRCKDVSKTLSEYVRDEVKSMHYPRYRFIAVVSIGQMKNATLTLGSRCIWDDQQDNFACSTFSNGSIFAVAQVYAVFQD
ncbi:hypothetical protein FSP39_000165 [Pinctada imbricata]|uniref:Uncharacterized protein n=1 Tax=Pinctada imbricata TaxID=66713 RepID=A0AA88XWA0_PINIB|nr:hypothetical protein FSP39_000165 [Pinctada imbricata]